VKIMLRKKLARLQAIFSPVVFYVTDSKRQNSHYLN